MSHIVQIQTMVKDAAAVRAACKRMGLAEPVEGTVKLFSGEVTGLAVQLPEWVYPAVVDLGSGQVKFDNFNGQWGDQAHLDRFLQAYAVCKAVAEARCRGHACTEQKLDDGSIKLAIQVQGGAA